MVTQRKAPKKAAAKKRRGSDDEEEQPKAAEVTQRKAPKKKGKKGRKGSDSDSAPEKKASDKEEEVVTLTKRAKNVNQLDPGAGDIKKNSGNPTVTKSKRKEIDNKFVYHDSKRLYVKEIEKVFETDFQQDKELFLKKLTKNQVVK